MSDLRRHVGGGKSQRYTNLTPPFLALFCEIILGFNFELEQRIHTALDMLAYAFQVGYP